MYGTVVRSARLVAGLTQSQLAAVAGLDQPNISAIEANRRQPTLDTLQRLLAGCGHALVAVGSAGSLPLPHPDEQDDVLAMRTSPARPASAQEANRILMGALSVAEAVVRARAS